MKKWEPNVKVDLYVHNVYDRQMAHTKFAVYYLHEISARKYGRICRQSDNSYTQIGQEDYELFERHCQYIKIYKEMVTEIV